MQSRFMPRLLRGLPIRSSHCSSLKILSPRFLSSSPNPSPASSPVFVPSLSLWIPSHTPSVDPFSLVSSDLSIMTTSIQATISVLQHPALDAAASHLLSLHGKRLRPIIVLLMAHATSLSAVPIMSSQRRLAEITELIHAASLLHDDVIDVAESRRGQLSVNSLFGNQLAVLAGDFLLARASVALARLRDCDVVELLSTVIEHLVRGEVIQMRGGGVKGGIGDTTTEQAEYNGAQSDMERYVAKTFFKTASLIANSCRAVTMLGGCTKDVGDVAYRYGENVGIGFQLMDDLLDFVGTTELMGKPTGNDLRSGVVTAPVLFAMEESDEVRDIVRRGEWGDAEVDTVLDHVRRGEGVERTREMAREYVRRGVVEVVDTLPPSAYRSALVRVGEFVLERDR